MDFNENICNLPEICTLTLHRLPDDKGYAIDFITYAEAATNSGRFPGLWTSKILSHEDLNGFYHILQVNQLDIN